MGRRRAVVRGAVLHGAAACPARRTPSATGSGVRRRSRRRHDLRLGRRRAGLGAPRRLARRARRLGGAASARRRDQFWDPMLQKAAEPEWIAMGERTRDLLLATMPHDPDVGVFHGDFQTNNILFDGADVVAVARLGDQRDRRAAARPRLAADHERPASWSDGARLARRAAVRRHGRRGTPTASRAVGRRSTTSRWYRALSGYRFGVISGLNVMLHRTGKRPDPEWERHRPERALPLRARRRAPRRRLTIAEGLDDAR